MKKIYMILAAITLLSLSLNAQRTDAVNHANHQLNSVQAKGFDLNSLQRENSLSINDMLTRFNPVNMGKPQVSPNGDNQKRYRAPLRLNSNEVTVGPFTGDNFDNGLGFGDAYSQPQYVFINTVLNRSEFADHIGDEIVGFRFALAGDVTSRVRVSQFTAWPIDFNSGSFDQDHLYSWPLTDFVDVVVPTIDQYEKVTSTSDLESGAEYLIVYEAGNVAFNGALTTLDVGNNVISVSRNGNIIESNATTDAATFTITANGNYYTIRSKSGHYIGRTSSSNGFNESATTVYNNSITFNNNNVVIRGRSGTNNNATNTYYLRFNSATGSNNYRFRYYAQTSQQNIQLYKKVTVSGTAPNYVELQAGQWHEFYLDEPVEFQVGSDVTNLFMGYEYVQYPTGTSGENLFPIAVNSQSATHDHYAYLTTETQGSGTSGDITISIENCFQTSFYYILVVDNETDEYLTYWTSNGSTYTANNNICYELPNGWTLNGATYMYQEVVSGYNLGYLSTNGPASIVISNSAFNGKSNVSVIIAAAGWADNYTVSVNGDSQVIESGTIADYEWARVNFDGSGSSTTTSTGWNYFNFNDYGDLAVQLIFKTEKPTPNAPTVSSSDGDASTTITITPDPNTDGTLSYYVIDQNGNQTQNLTFPRGESDYTVEVHAYTTATDNYNQSPEAVVTVTIPGMDRTATPDIDYEVVGDNVVITATGDGTVTLTVGDQTASGDGSASITIPRLLFDYVVTAKATAQESGKLVSNEATEDITIPGLGGEGWLPMDGTYTGNEALNFIDEATQKPIVFVDQFIGETMYNQHPDKYEYVLKEEATGETSSTVPVTVYKTSSTVNGLYTLEEVENDKNLELKANVVNSTMVYDIKTDNNMFYYGLFRGEKNGNYPIIDIAHRYSMLQQSIEQTDDNVTNFFNEALNNNVLPDYNNIGDGTVKRIDMEFVEGQQNDWIDYVPVIWTFGHNTGRTDGKNNSYGSDIKRSVLGGVTPDFIRGTLSTNNDVHQNDYGTWDAPNNEKYCVYTPFMRVSGFSPDDYNANDGDQYTFEPYMFRVWCVYDQARDFTRNSDGQLIDNGVTSDMEDGTFLLQTVYVDDPSLSSIYFGKEQWVEADGRLPYTFGVPVSVANDPSALKFIIRFYYKRSVVEGGTQPSGLRGNRDGGEEYYIAEATGDGQDITTGIFDLFMGKSVVGVTYVNAQGMKSDKPFDGVNIVITRYSDGTTSTSKIIR